MRAVLRGLDVLLVHENMRPILSTLRASHIVHCLWEHVDKAGYLHDHGDKIGVIVTAGENRIAPDLVDSLPALGLILCVGAGYDGVDVAHCGARGVAVLAANGVNAADVADYTVGLAIAAWRGIVADNEVVRGGGWSTANRLPQKHAMHGAPVGIVGLGAIGQAVAARLEAFGMMIRWWAPREQPDACWPRAESLHALALESQMLIVCCRADPSSRHLIDRAIIEAVGPEGIVVNISRGSVIDEDSMIAALKDGRLGGAALDVFEEEPTPASRWIDVPNIILTPHAAGLTIDTLQAMVGLAVERVAVFLGDDEGRRRELLEQRVV